jgi:hypothetical protein
MIEPMLFDVVETIYPLGDSDLATKAQGTIVHSHGDGSFEIEFADENGETVAVHTLTRDQFIVVWQANVGGEVPLAEQVAQIVALLPDRAGTEVLDFARFLTWQRQKTAEVLA